MAPITLTDFKSQIGKLGLEEQFLKLTGLTSMNELSPENFDESFGKADSLTKSLTLPSAGPSPPADRQKSDADAKETPSLTSASDFLYGFKHMQVLYSTRRKVSKFTPCAYMMMFIVHELNSLLVEHFYFKRAAPNYHPLLFRLYFGILFYVQSLRAAHAANALDNHEDYQFLDRFLDAFPPEILCIPAPLLHIFKSLCASQPEIPQIGFVTPYIHNKFLGKKFSDGPQPGTENYILPDIPGILSLIRLVKTLDGKTSDLKSYFGNTTDDRSFHGITYDKDPTSWSNQVAWSLRLPGLEYLPEGVKSFHKQFVDDRLDELDLPVPSASDEYKTLQDFLYLKKMSWFRDLVEMVGSACRFLPGSGSLADCSPMGAPVCQIQTNVSGIAFDAKPASFVKDNSFYVETSMQLTTSARQVDQLSMIMASASHLNVRIKGVFLNVKSRYDDPFWSLGPLEKSQLDESALFSVKDTIKKMLLDKAK